MYKDCKSARPVEGGCRASRTGVPDFGALPNHRACADFSALPLLAPKIGEQRRGDASRFEIILKLSEKSLFQKKKSMLRN